jgi:hypothetical protein
VLWGTDFFKAKWAIVAKAYSIIRDRVGKANAPLASFMALVCPMIGIPSPAEYFDLMGWMYPDTEKELKRRFLPDVSQFDTTTTLSPTDIVSFCEFSGYYDSSTCKY